jgi:hypothetical protein
MSLRNFASKAKSFWLPPHAITARFSTSSAQTSVPNIPFYPVYVHHLSQIALEHLQNHHSDWVVQMGLDRGLRINQDGTFVLQFPETEEGYDGGRIW